MAYSRFSEVLYKTAQSWAGKWTRYANQRLLSSPEAGIPKSLKGIIEIYTQVERHSAQRFSLILTAKGKGEHVTKYGHGAALAGAYEYGAKPHKITPRPPKQYLVFYWERMDSVVRMREVSHPGIEAAMQGQGYAYWSRYKLLKEGKAELTELGRRAILTDLQFAFKGKK